MPDPDAPNTPTDLLASVPRSSRIDADSMPCGEPSANASPPCARNTASMSACDAAYTGAKCSGIVFACSADSTEPPAVSSGAVMLGITDTCPYASVPAITSATKSPSPIPVGSTGRKMPHAVVHRPQFQVRHHREIPLPPSHDGHKRSHRNVLQRRHRRSIQPYVQPTRQRPAHHHSKPVQPTQRTPVRHMSVPRDHAAISRSIACSLCESRASSCASARPARSMNA